MEMSRENVIRAEVSNWLGSAAIDDENDLTQLNLTQFPHIRRLFIKFNTIMTSSAPVERLFSFAKMILRPQRQNLSDQRYEQILILKSRSNISV